MCEKQMEETTVNFPSQSVHKHIWKSGVPKIDLMASDWCPGSEGSAANPPGPVWALCLH